LWAKYAPKVDIGASLLSSRPFKGRGKSGLWFASLDGSGQSSKHSGRFVELVDKG
jgi:hypothetical protein